MKLAYKLFSIFLLMSLLIVVLMVGTLHYFATRQISEFVGKIEMEQLGEIVARLKDEYSQHQGWDHLRANEDLWGEIIRTGPERREMMFPPLPMPDAPLHGMEGPEHSLPGPPMPHDIKPRLALYDSQKRLVIGRALSAQDQIFKAISADGKVVGWLGLRKPDRSSDPRQVDYLYKQAHAFILIGSCILVLAAIVA